MKDAAKEPVKEEPKEASRKRQGNRSRKPPRLRLPRPKPAAPPPAAASVDARRDSDGLRVTFPLQVATPAAAFRRGDTVWLVFDSQKPIDVEAIRARGGAMIGEVSRMPLDKGQAVRIRLTRPLVYSLTQRGGRQGDQLAARRSPTRSRRRRCR